MTYTFPYYLINQSQPSPVLDYVWDDTQGYLNHEHEYDASDLADKIGNVTIRAQTALCTGVYEWIVWRFHCLSDDPVAFQIAETAWWGNIRAAYIEECIELDPTDYCGPVQNPLGCAISYLAFLFDGTLSLRVALMYLSSLAMHVLPDTQPFENWLKTVTDRLLTFYLAPEDDPFEDIFNDHEEERRGPLVAREVLDPSFDYHPDQAPMLLDQFLCNVDHAKNPFLHSPEELIGAGIEHPYQILP